jgi:hypothetical protein
METASRYGDMEGSCEYIEQAVANSQQEVVLHLWRLNERLTASYHKKPACYEMLYRASDLDGFFAQR